MLTKIRLRGIESLRSFVSREEIVASLRPDVQFKRRALNVEEEAAVIADINPVDGVEFTSWMHEAGGMNALFFGIAEAAQSPRVDTAR